MDSAAGIGDASDKPDAVIKDEASSYLYEGLVRRPGACS